MGARRRAALWRRRIGKRVGDHVVAERRAHLRMAAGRDDQELLAVTRELVADRTGVETRREIERRDALARTRIVHAQHRQGQELARPGNARRTRGARAGDRRASYSVLLTMPHAMRARLKGAAQKEMRSVSGFVGRVIMEALAAGKESP